MVLRDYVQNCWSQNRNVGISPKSRHVELTGSRHREVVIAQPNGSERSSRKYWSKKGTFELLVSPLRIDTGDERPLWQKGTIFNTKTGIDMHHISTEKEYFPLSIDIFNFESKYGGRKL